MALSAAARAWRNRGASLAFALGLVWAACELEPDPGRRALALYGLVLVLGYAHLLGSAWFSARSFRGRRGVAGTALGALLLLGGFAAYGALLETAPLVVLPLLVISTWHTVENDVVLAATCARSSGAAPAPREPAPHLLAFGGTALLLAIFASTGAGPVLATLTDTGPLSQVTPAPWRGLAAGLALALAVAAPAWRGAAALLATAAAFLPEAVTRGLTFPDVFALFGLYHLLSWLGILVERGHLRRLLAVHAPPAVVYGVLFMAPDHPGTASARAFALSPAVYLFWSVLHVGQTFRERARRGGPKPHRGPGPGS